MSTIEQIKYEGMKEELTEKLTEDGIRVLVQDNLEERVPKERILIKLQKHYNLTEEKARQYYEKYASEA